MVYKLTDDKKEELYNQIELLFDLTDEIANSIGANGVQNRTQQFDIAQPFMLQLYASAERISEIYTNCIQNNSPISPQQKSDMESAFAGIFYSLKTFSEAIEQLPRN